MCPSFHAHLLHELLINKVRHNEFPTGMEARGNSKETFHRHFVDQLDDFLDNYEEEHGLARLEPVNDDLIKETEAYKNFIKMLQKFEEDFDRKEEFCEKFSSALSRSTALMVNVMETMKDTTSTMDVRISQGKGDGQLSFGGTRTQP